ncbi:hypothetical protein TrVE_jg5598 [Triparma verrucosa]|uniref:Ribosome-binding factor A n=1 Tax=Triparma verrucosa TaxID=1606542 RepID=A0A9W7B9R7_9STRA|nr:hypothetical protein TrVE_jg5598 [Triparma verrucosa]
MLRPLLKPTLHLLPLRSYHVTPYNLVPKKRSIRRPDRPDPLQTQNTTIRKNLRKKADKQRRLKAYEIYARGEESVVGDSDVFVGKKNEESLFKFFSGKNVDDFEITYGDEALRLGKKRFENRLKGDTLEDSSNDSFSSEINELNTLNYGRTRAAMTPVETPPQTFNTETKIESKRVLRVTAQLESVLTSLFNSPDSEYVIEGQGVVISGIKMSPDLRYATVVWSANERVKEEIEGMLEENRRRLEVEASGRMRLKFRTEFRFRCEEGGGGGRGGEGIDWEGIGEEIEYFER